MASPSRRCRQNRPAAAPTARKRGSRGRWRWIAGESRERRRTRRRRERRRSQGGQGGALTAGSAACERRGNYRTRDGHSKFQKRGGARHRCDERWGVAPYGVLSAALNIGNVTGAAERTKSVSPSTS